MKGIFFVFFGAFSLSAAAQQFSFRMVFKDAANNTDTLVLGYDDNASNGINSAFGEQNIAGTPYKTGLDVRASNIWWKDYANAMSYLQGTSPFVDVFLNAPVMQSKIQIVQNTHSCTLGSIWKGPFNQLVPIIELNIKADVWPVTAYWDSAAFDNPCRNGSVLTSMHPGAWWDGGFNKLKAELRDMDSVRFYPSSYSTPSTGGATAVPVYWLAFGDSSLAFDDAEMEWLLLSVAEAKHVNATVFPNPTTGKVTIRTAPAFGQIKTIHVYTPAGQKVQSVNGDEIDLSAYSSGLYFAEILNAEGIKIYSTIQKQ